jgi:hypothetical protein
VYCVEEAVNLLSTMQSTATRSSVQSAVESFLMCVDLAARTDTSFRQLVASLCAEFLLNLGLKPEDIVTRIVESRLEQRAALGYRDPYNRTAMELVLAENFYVSDVVEGLLNYIRNIRDEEEAQRLGGLVYDMWKFCRWGKISEARLILEQRLAEHLARYLATQHKTVQMRQALAGFMSRVLATTLTSIARAVSTRRRRRRRERISP